MIKYFTFFMCLYGFGCRTSLDSAKVQPYKDPIEIAIDDAIPKIRQLLRNGGIKPKNKQMYFRVYGQTKNSDEKALCELFNNQEGYSYVRDNILFDFNMVTAMIIDDNNEYIAWCSPFGLGANANSYKMYGIELKMIDLCKKNSYIAFVKIFNCKGANYIGYKKGKIDVYRLVDSNLVFVYSK